MKTHITHVRSDEQGIALVIALFMMLAMSVLGTSLMFVSKTETLSSHNYRLMSQARYGAESGIHVAANYLMGPTYGAVMPGTGGDPLSGYDLTKSPVQFGGTDVILSSTSGSGNYPVQAVKDAFVALFANATLDVNDAPVAYKATATLKAMRQINDQVSNTTAVVQTWEIVGEGSIDGARKATVEVSTMIEREVVPIFAYAAFSTDPGCASMTFGGGGQTNSYDSRNITYGADGRPVTNNSYGDVGSNGNLTASGSNNTAINGSLSTPRTGVGACTQGNVTAETINGQASVTGGLIQLAQTVTYPQPPAPSPMPPVGTAVTFQGSCPAAAGAGCVMAQRNGTGPLVPTLDPSLSGGVITLSEVATNANTTLVLKGGHYNFNSLKMNGQTTIYIDATSQPVVIDVAGLDSSGQPLATPVIINGGGMVTSNFKPTDFVVRYGGTGEVQLNGGEKAAALVYAPKASGKFTGSADLYGAVVVNKLTDMGGAQIHYDIAMKNDALTAGNYMLSAFTWKNY